MNRGPGTQVRGDALAIGDNQESVIKALRLGGHGNVTATTDIRDALE